MTIWRKAAIGAALAVACVTGVGYVTAWLSLTPCADETFREIQRQGISGTDMLADKVALTRNDVSASVVGPFLVEAGFMVPHGLHGSIHSKQYIVLPWGRYEHSSEVIDLVMAPKASRWPIANHSIEWNALRGSA